MPYQDEVVISTYGGGRPRRLPVIDVNVSWELSNVGSFSAFTRLADLREAGCAGELKGSWLQWQHPYAGRWGGVITGRPISDGVAEIAAEGWGALLRHHPLGEWSRPTPGPAAGLARRGVLAVDADEPSYVRLGAVDESGPWIPFRSGGQDLLDDYLPELVDAGELEWSVDADRVLFLGQRIGVDRAAQVRLTEGVEILTASFADDAYVAQDVESFHVALPQQMSYTPSALPGLTGTPVLRTVESDRRKKRKRRWRDPQHRRRREHPRTALPVVGPALPPTHPPVFVVSQKPEYVRRLQTETVPVTLTIANRNNAFRHTQLGDRVRIVVESAAFSGVFRILVRGLDMAQDELQLAGEAIADTSPLRGPYRATRGRYRA